MQNLGTYHGRPCKNCQGTLRRVSNRSCIECARTRNRAFMNAFLKSENGRDYIRSEKRKENLKRYKLSEKGAATYQRYRGSEKQRACFARAAAKPKAKLARSLRDRVRKVLKRSKGIRAGSAVRDLGCTIDFFRGFIEDKFARGMSWENYGEWHLDHVKPLKLFDLTDRRQFLEACHYTNYQPLRNIDNWQKSARYEAA